jgi:hypothetical protein
MDRIRTRRAGGVGVGVIVGVSVEVGLAVRVGVSVGVSEGVIVDVDPARGNSLPGTWQESRVSIRKGKSKSLENLADGTIGSLYK